jgi:hypothetical protein
VYIFILADVKHEEKDEEIERKNEEIKRKNEEIKRIIEEKDEEIKRKNEEIKRILEEKNEEIKRKDEETDEKLRKEIYRISKTAWNDFVGEDFEIKNGVLGLERDVYLSIVKFLDSHTLRKV